MKEKNYQILFPLKGGTEVIVSDKERDLKIVFDYKEPLDLDDEKVFDFIINDVVKQMNEIVDQHDSFDGNQLINPSEIA
jgi:hypothetical protein